MEPLSKNKIKWIRSLRLKKNRDAEGVFVVEGEKMVNELLALWPENIVFICTTIADKYLSCESYFVDEQIMHDISSMKTPNKYLAIVKLPTFKPKESSLILVVDGIQDPGNMGTILRTADWFDVDEIVCSLNTVDIFNSKVVQSSMGSIFRIPVSYKNLMSFLPNCGLPIYGALLEGNNIYEQKLNKSGAIIVGNEGGGITEQVQKFIQHPINIPKFGGAESLNVAVATGIILSEFAKSSN